MLNVEHILSLVEKAGFTDNSVSDALHWGNGSIRRWSKHTPSVDKLFALSNLIGVPVGAFFEEDAGVALSPEERELLSAVEGLPPIQMGKVIGYALGLREPVDACSEQRKKEKSPTSSDARVI